VAGTALPRRLTWQLGTVTELIEENARCKSILLELSDWSGHRAGQHVDIRLTAEDGYQAQRSYSIASPPEHDTLMLTVERLDDGEVSPYLTDELRAGDQLELRGPIGGYFIWEDGADHPRLMVAGGSGVVPFRAMLCHHRAVGSAAPIRLLYSARSLQDVIYRDELVGREDVHVALTREWPPDWEGHRGRIDGELLGELAWPADRRPLCYVCGPTGFVEAVAEALVDTGHDPSQIRTERFGPTGS
jgi:ferredoxin-NADP reductase